MTRRGVAVAAVVVALAAGVCTAAVRIPLAVTEDGGMSRARGWVSTGVPLLPGQVKDVKALHLLDGRGAEVTAQFRPLARWWRKDNSLRWVLVDFIAPISGFETKTFYLTDDASKTSEVSRTSEVSALTVKQTDEAIVVTTGTAQFTISRKRFNLFDRVRLDRNGDGRFTGDEECISPRPDSGSIVEDTYGTAYYSGEGVSEVRVEETGPVRVCVVAKGVHRARDGKGYSRGMYGYDVRMHFYAGQNLVRLDPVITNTGPAPNGSPTFEDYSLVTRLNLQPEPNPNPAVEDKTPLVMCRIYGRAPLDGDLRAGRSVVLYQDSNGAETWQVNPGVEGENVRSLPSFRGYRVVRRGGKAEEVLSRGDHARGVVAVGGKDFGVVIVPRYFWQLFPKAVEVGHDGAVRIGILPRECKGVHWIQDAGAAGQEVWLHFYARGLKKPAKPHFPRDTTTRSMWHGLVRDRPWPHVVADALIPRLVALCPREHYAACGALADIGPYEPIRATTGFPLAIRDRRLFMTDYLKGNGYGWQCFGCRWEEHAGHSPWNYEPIGSSSQLFNYINTRQPTWLAFALRRFKHFRDVRAFKIDGTKPFEHTSWAEFGRTAVCEDYCKRPQPTGAEIERFSRGRYRRRGWFLPNPAHNNLDELHDLYCFFGDTRALAGMRSIAAVGGAYVALRPVGIHRSTGWCLRSLMRYRDITGSDECVPFVRRAVDNAWRVAVANRHVPRINYGNTWFYNVFGRAVVLAYGVTGDERMRDLAIGMTSGRTTKSAHPTLNAFAYDQTGRAVHLSSQAAAYARIGGYFPACDAHLWLKPRPDKTPPAAVADLRAKPLGGGRVRLTWTAPGDDGRDGTAAVYQVKWSDLPIVETANDKEHVNFWAAENVTGEPSPSRAGAAEALVVEGLKPGAYVFALKTRDELNNESDLSTTATATVE